MPYTVTWFLADCRVTFCTFEISGFSVLSGFSALSGFLVGEELASTEQKGLDTGPKLRNRSGLHPHVTPLDLPFMITPYLIIIVTWSLRPNL